MEEENLEMGLFTDENLDLDLNFLPTVEDLEDQPDGEEAPEGQEQEVEDTSQPSEEEDNPLEGEQNDETNLSEGDDPEKVAGGEEGQEGSDDSPTLYSSFASVLVEQGLLPSQDLQDKEIKSIEDLTSLFSEEINNQVKQQIIAKVGEDGYEALEKGVSLAEYQQHRNDAQTLDSITEDTIKDNQELAKQIILEDYIAQGLSESKAKRLLEKTIDLGEETLLEDATEALGSLKALQQKRLEQLAAQREQEALEMQKQQEQIDNDLKNAIYKTDEFVKGIKADKAIQDRVYKSITNIVGKSPQGHPENQLMRDRRENPIEFDTKLYYLYEVTKGFKDFSKFIKKSESTAAQQLTEQLRKTRFDTSGTPTYAQDDNSYDGILGTELNID